MSRVLISKCGGVIVSLSPMTLRHWLTTDICKTYRQMHVLPQCRININVPYGANRHIASYLNTNCTLLWRESCAVFSVTRVLNAIASDDCDGFDAVRHADNSTNVRWRYLCWDRHGGRGARTPIKFNFRVPTE